MRQVSKTTILEYIYTSREERDEHVSQMEKAGWEGDGQVKRIKPDYSIWSTDSETGEGYEYYARFYSNGDIHETD